MAESSPFDPMKMWRDLVSQWEKGSNEFANQAMASDPFRQGMHGGMNASLAVQKALGEMMARYLSTLNLPRRDDLQAMGNQLQQIEVHLGSHRAPDGSRTRRSAAGGSRCGTAGAHPSPTAARRRGTAPGACARAQQEERKQDMSTGEGATPKAPPLLPDVRAEIERAIQRNIKGLEFLDFGRAADGA